LVQLRRDVCALIVPELYSRIVTPKPFSDAANTTEYVLMFAEQVGRTVKRERNAFGPSPLLDFDSC
jgi:hypothetical protein